MSKDPLFNGGGGLTSDVEVAIVSVGQQQTAAARALAAYQQNIAVPGVHVTGRALPFSPQVLGEDGQPMTLERRQELMRGKQPMVVNGRPSNVTYINEKFDIKPEVLGTSAQKAAEAEGMRVVKPVAASATPTEVVNQRNFQALIEGTGDLSPVRLNKGDGQQFAAEGSRLIGLLYRQDKVLPSKVQMSAHTRRWLAGFIGTATDRFVLGCEVEEQELGSVVRICGAKTYAEIILPMDSK